jgi:hypothetical protein
MQEGGNGLNPDGRQMVTVPKPHTPVLVLEQHRRLAPTVRSDPELGVPKWQ